RPPWSVRLPGDPPHPHDSAGSVRVSASADSVCLLDLEPLFELLPDPLPEFLCGARTIIMFRPSCFGFDSMKPSSDRSSASLSSKRNPSSGRDCSRPRNMIVTLTLFPPARNRDTWPFLVS